MTKQPACPSVMMSLACRQEMRVGGESTQRLQVVLLEYIGRSESCLTNLTNQLPLSLDKFVWVRGRQTLHKRRVPRNLLVDCRLRSVILSGLSDKLLTLTIKANSLPDET